MAKFALPSPDLTSGTLEEKLNKLAGAYNILKKTLENSLYHLDNTNIDEITANKITTGTLDANVVNIVNFTADAGEVYYISADTGKILNLAVDELITMFVEEGLEEYHYIHIYDENLKWISAYRKYYDNGTPYPDIQLEDSDGLLLYWTDDTHSAMTTNTESPAGDPLEPVMVHQYDFLTKLSFGFDDITYKNGTIAKAPIMWWGAGSGNGNNGRARIYKDLDGLSLTYFNATTGEQRKIDLNDTGIEITPAILKFPDATNDSVATITTSGVVLDGISVTFNNLTKVSFDLQIDATSSEALSATIEARAGGITHRTTTKYFSGAYKDQIVFNGVFDAIPLGDNTIDIKITTDVGTLSIAEGDYRLMLTVRNGLATEAPPWPEANIFDSIEIDNILMDSINVSIVAINNANISDNISIETNINDEAEVLLT